MCEADSRNGAALKDMDSHYVCKDWLDKDRFNASLQHGRTAVGVEYVLNQFEKHFPTDPADVQKYATEIRALMKTKGIKLPEVLQQELAKLSKPVVAK